MRILGVCLGLALAACGGRSGLFVDERADDGGDAGQRPDGMGASDASSDGGDATVEAEAGPDSAAGDVTIRDALASDSVAADAPVESSDADASRPDSGPDVPPPCRGPPGPPLAFAQAVYCDDDGSLEAVVARDLNGDGHFDLVAADASAPAVLVFLGAGDGTFASPQKLPVSDAPVFLELADFNGDGVWDLAVGHESSTLDRQVSILLGRGDGSFGAEQLVGAGGWPRALAAADFDGDAKVDLAVDDGLDDDVTVLLGNGDGTFRSAGHFPAGPAPDGVVAVDWNQDGRLDLAVSDQNFGLQVLLGKGDGSFAPGPGFAGSLNGGQVVAGDLDCDGRVDLVAADMQIDGGITVVTGGSPPSTIAYPVGTWGPFGVALADMNGDGTLDVVTSSPNAVAGDQALFVLPGRGDGTFGAAQNLGPYTYRNLYPWTVATADFDEDGATDLAVAEGTGPLAILLNRTGASADAGGGPRTAGACGPPEPVGIHAIVTLAQGQSDPFGVTVDDASVYWTNFDYPDFDAGTVMKVAKSGGGSPVVLAGGQASPGDLAVDPSNVYWANYNGNAIQSVPIAGGTPARIAVAGGIPLGVQVDGSRVYWGNETEVLNGPSPSYGLLAVPLAGGSPARLCCDMMNVYGVAADATNLYVAAGDVVEVPKDGSPPVTLVAGEHAYAVAVDTVNVYWTRVTGGPGTGAVMTKSIAGADPPRPLASGLHAPGSVVSDGANVYWLDESTLDGAVMGAPVTGGSPAPVAWGQRGPARIAVDATRIYWTERLSGRVQSMAK